MVNRTSEYIPAVSYLGASDDGSPRLVGSRCPSCEVTLVGKRLACPSCANRGPLQPVQLSHRGTLYNYTVVHRSFPGVRTPFISGIVDLDGGGTLKGTLVDIDHDSAALQRDLPVDVVFRDTGQRTTEGKPFLSYYFTPRRSTDGE